ncbi:MAG: CHAT domain-containing protein, partial [Acidimicrobiia bacterium]|nr:CHAT domain-containing protein [Acidimicrobiia bacterium]
TDALVTWERLTADTDPEMRRRLTDARHRVLELEERLRTEGTDPLDELSGRLNDYLGPGAEGLGMRVLASEWKERTQAAEARASLTPILDDARRRFRAVVEEVWGEAAEPTPLLRATDVATVAATSGYPLIYVVPSTHGTIALIVEPDGPVQTIEFPELDSARLSRLLHGDDGGSPSFLRGAYYRDADALDASLEQVVPFLNRHLLDRLDDAVERLGYRQAAIVAMGLLALLPCHARDVGDGVAFRMVPSARVLRIAQESRPEPPLATPRVYVLAAPEVEGQDRLGWAVIEALAVEAQVEARGATVSLAVGDEPARVLGQLEAANLAHLACHANFRPSDPLASALHVGRNAVVTLGDMAGGRRDFTGLELVVMSACRTAAIEADRPDDALGFPSQLLVAGAAGVVSTAWLVHDDTAAFFAHRFYQELADGRDPAMATQRARAWLRSATGDDLLGVVIELMELVPAEDADAHAVLTECRRSLLTQRETRPYEHPIDWAAFAYSGV